MWSVFLFVHICTCTMLRSREWYVCFCIACWGIMGLFNFVLSRLNAYFVGCYFVHLDLESFGENCTWSQFCVQYQVEIWAHPKIQWISNSRAGQSIVVMWCEILIIHTFFISDYPLSPTWRVDHFFKSGSSEWVYAWWPWVDYSGSTTSPRVAFA